MQYKDYDISLQWGSYPNGRPALQLIDTEDGQPVTVATVNMPEVSLEDGEVCVKNYSENEGMLDWLVENDLVQDTGKRVGSGYVQIPIVRLKEEKSRHGSS